MTQAEKIEALESTLEALVKVSEDQKQQIDALEKKVFEDQKQQIDALEKKVSEGAKNSSSLVKKKDRTEALTVKEIEAKASKVFESNPDLKELFIGKFRLYTSASKAKAFAGDFKVKKINKDLKIS